MNERDALLRLDGMDEALDAAAEKLGTAIHDEMRRTVLREPMNHTRVLMGADECKVADAGWPSAITNAAERDMHRRVMFVDKAAYAWLNRTAEEIAALERVCTPAGLRSLFPGLRG